MKLTIFGATGGVGRHAVEQALKQGHEVTAVTRRPEIFEMAQANLRVLAGDALDPHSVRRAVEGQDAVICALGKPMMNRDNLRAVGTNNIIRAMEACDVRRFVCLSGLGAGDSRDLLPWRYRFFIIPLMLRFVYADHEQQERYVRNSLLDWIIVRPGSFADGTARGQYKHGFTRADGSFTFKIPRADVADFMLRQVTADTYLRQCPAVSY